MTSEKYLFAGSGDGENTYIYRLDRKGNILRANITDQEYHYFDRAELPNRVIREFAEGSLRFWGESSTVTPKPLSWNIPENASDTGITDQEFIDLVLEKWPNTRFNTETHHLEIEITLGDGTKKYVRIPNSALKFLANRNRYYGNAYWMV